MKPYFGRLITAMITFFHEDGSLNAEGTAEFASWLVDHGSDAILVAGTSGEAPTLTYDEKKELLRLLTRSLTEELLSSLGLDPMIRPRPST